MSVEGLSDTLHSPAYEDGTDSEFRNVGSSNSDAGELPKKEQITFRIRRKLKNRKIPIVFNFVRFCLSVCCLICLRIFTAIV